ncbi:MAG: SGNH/GDSL hydrolase family protein [Bryobacteraceae bacterium]|nr:SGNH/GDSL hydrolase family protein [Bryobacteraceae bacterium]
MKAILLLCLFCALAFGQTAAPAAPTTPATDDALKLRTELERGRKVLQDWPNLERYRSHNEALGPPASGEQRVVFLGDSITDGWGRKNNDFFPGKPYVNRGISGQTTPQMLIRFRPDVIDLKPVLVVILAGTNDLAGNTGPVTIQTIEGNLQSMAELATANNIKVVMSSVMPVCDYHRMQTDRRPPAKIIALNEWIKNYAAKKGHVYLDYYTPMLDEAGMLRKEITNDGLHPNEAGYALMAPLVQKAIDQVLSRPGESRIP